MICNNWFNCTIFSRGFFAIQMLVSDHWQSQCSLYFSYGWPSATILTTFHNQHPKLSTIIISTKLWNLIHKIIWTLYYGAKNLFLTSASWGKAKSVENCLPIPPINPRTLGYFLVNCLLLVKWWSKECVFVLLADENGKRRFWFARPKPAASCRTDHNTSRTKDGFQSNRTAGPTSAPACTSILCKSLFELLLLDIRVCQRQCACVVKGQSESAISQSCFFFKHSYSNYPSSSILMRHSPSLPSLILSPSQVIAWPLASYFFYSSDIRARLG